MNRLNASHANYPPEALLFAVKSFDLLCMLARVPLASTMKKSLIPAVRESVYNMFLDYVTSYAERYPDWFMFVGKEDLSDVYLCVACQRECCKGCLEDDLMEYAHFVGISLSSSFRQITSVTGGSLLRPPTGPMDFDTLIEFPNNKIIPDEGVMEEEFLAECKQALELIPLYMEFVKNDHMHYLERTEEMRG